MSSYPGIAGQPAPPEPPGTAGQPRTGHDVVDGALADLSGAAHLPPVEQIAAFEDVHRRLSATLRGIDDD